MAWIRASQETPGAFPYWNGSGYDWYIDQAAGTPSYASTQPLMASGTEGSLVANPSYNPNAVSAVNNAQTALNAAGGGLDYNAYDNAMRALQMARGDTPGTGLSGTGGMYGQQLQGLLMQLGITPNQWVNEVQPLAQGNTTQDVINAIAQYKGINPSQLSGQAQQLDSLWNNYQGGQTALNADHGMGTFLTLLALATGGGALLGGGFGAGVGANAAGAMGIETGAGGLGLGAGEGLVGWDALGNAIGGGTGPVGSLAGEAGWGVTQGAGDMFIDPWDVMGDLSAYGLGDGGTSADLLALLDSPAGGGGSMTDWWTQAMGSGSNYSLSDLLNIGGFPSTSGLSDLLGNFGSGGDSLGKTIGGLLGGSSNNLLGATLGLAPILGGLTYAYNKAGPDLSKLNSLYDTYNPNAMTGQFDLNTGIMRDNLLSSLTRRGVMGSSFANQDLTNLQTSRDIGRAQLLGQAVGPAAGIASEIAKWQTAEDAIKSDLIGRGLYSIGTLFGGRQ